MAGSSVRARVHSAIVASAGIFALALGLWGVNVYQSSQADVIQTGNRVLLNFDELPEGVINPITRQYASYGVRFSSEPVTLGDAPLAVMNFTPLAASHPNALIGATVDANGVNPAPGQPQVIVFVDPANPDQAATTNFVKFILTADLNQWDSAAGDAGSVRVTAYGTGNEVKATRSLTTSGSQTVELRASGIGRVLIEGIHQQSTFGAVHAPPIFGVDDLDFQMPGSSAQAALTVTSQKSTYAVGETVSLTATNTGQTQLACANPPAQTIVQTHGQTGAAITPPTAILTVAAGTAQTLAPLATLPFTWNQQTSAGAAVSPGTFQVAVACGTTSANVSFVIAQAGETERQATLTTSKASYATGEAVSFTFTNTGTESITCPSAAPWVIKDGSGNLIFTPTSSQAAATDTLTPDQSRAYSWDQRKQDTSQVPSGNYVVTIRCTNIERSASFAISDDGTVDDLEFTVNPEQGVAPLFVTAAHTLPTPNEVEVETIDFDDLEENVFVTDQYLSDHRVSIEGTNGGQPITIGTAFGSQRCEGSGTEASSQPQYLAPRIGDLPGYGGVTFTFEDPVYQPGLTLLSVGQATVTVTYHGSTDQVVETQTVGGRTNQPDGACAKDQLAYTGTEPITKMAVSANEAAGGADAMRIADLDFATAVPTQNLTLTWDFGDGTVIPNGQTTQTHTYRTAGTYTVTLRRSDSRSGTKTVTVTPAQVSTTVVTLETDKSVYKPGESVTFTATNRGPGKIRVGEPSDPFHVLDSQGQLVKDTTAGSGTKILEPNGVISHSWDQKNLSGVRVAAGVYVVRLPYFDLATQASRELSRSFTIQETIDTSVTPTLTVVPPRGQAPLAVTATCADAVFTGGVLDFGDGTILQNVSCPSTTEHTHTQAGTFTVALRKNQQLLAQATVTVTAPPTTPTITPPPSGGSTTTPPAATTTSPTAPASLVSTGASLGTVLLIALILSGLVSYLMIRRPFHHDEEPDLDDSSPRSPIR